jgi:hypothetical protein
LLLIHGTTDALVEFETTTESVFANANWPTYRIELENGSHVGFVEGVPTLPGTHPDFLACLFFPPIDPSDPEAGEAFEYLTSRTPETGFVSPGPAPLPCKYGAQETSPWMVPQRQIELTKVGILAFALSHFGESPSIRAKAGTFLHETFNAENPDATLEAKEFSLDWLGRH